MFGRDRAWVVVVAGALFAAVSAFDAQDAVRTGPPPDIRALVDAFMKAANSSAEAWDAMTKERFSAEYLNKQAPDARKKLYENLRADFGTLAFARATRQGPDAPLDLHVTG